MKIAVLGTGVVGHAIASKLCALGHDVCMGARQANNDKAAAWVKATGLGASAGTFQEAAASSERVFNCTAGVASMDALAAAGADNLRDKLLIDVSNPLDFSRGMPPSLATPAGDSLGEQIQRAYPATRVVKTLNTVNCSLMVDPGQVGDGQHDMFLCGNDAAAKAEVTEILRGWFGWKNVVDFGDITGARALEAYVLFWVRAFGAVGTPAFNVRLVR